MNEQYTQVLDELNFRLEAVDLEEDNLLIKSQQSIELTRSAVDDVQQKVLEQSFPSQEAEIHFFKEIKPQFLGKLIYYVELHNVTLHLQPLITDKSQQKYLRQRLERIDAFFQKEVEFYRYYRMGHTYLDHRYFVLNNADPRLPIDWCYYIQRPHFTTTHDLMVANIIAYDQLSTYLKAEIIRLKEATTQIVPSGVADLDLHWSRPKIHLIELIYALDAVGAINQGNISIKQLASALEIIFQTDLGDVYGAASRHSFMKAKTRTNPTRFLDELKRALLDRIEQDYS